ncbi:hypothetical protein Q3G72_021109 [Acer saccharum]|nr:hypothetical protein Q3G72_009256 [Acer saccharum]KAK1588223.1 hypothetical protein Q3G72_021109 [Acer saccharum]
MKLICALIFALVYLFSITDRLAPPPPTPKYDHSWLVLTWPASFCLTETTCTKPPASFFTIHGIWPTDAAGNTLEKNVQTQASIAFLSDQKLTLVQQLNQYWPSFTSKTNVDFWKYEWIKHGSTQKPITPKQYFQSAINLGNQFDILAALIRNDVVPNGTSYKTSSFLRAIRSETKMQNVMLHCKDNFLTEVRLCVNYAATNYAPCNAAKELGHTVKTCGQGTIKFPRP